eukprot:6363778-Prymnesium_polylepis.1
MALFVPTLDAWIGSVQQRGRPVTHEDLSFLRDLGRNLDSGLRAELMRLLLKIRDTFIQLARECFPDLVADDPTDVTQLHTLEPLAARRHHENSDELAAERFYTVLQTEIEAVEMIVGVQSGG